MTITQTGLYKTAGVCAVVGGAIYCAVQIGHPSATVAHVTTTNVQLRETAKVVFAVLGLVGITGMYLCQRRRLGVVGLAGYVLFAAAFLLLFATECIVGYILPVVARTDPRYVQGVLDVAVGKSTSVNIGHMKQIFILTGICYPVGGLLFGLAQYRARVLARWACALLAIGTVAVLALAALPESYNRPFAVPTGIALIGLGVSLYRNQSALTPDTETTITLPEQTRGRLDTESAPPIPASASAEAASHHRSVQ